MSGPDDHRDLLGVALAATHAAVASVTAAAAAETGSCEAFTKSSRTDYCTAADRASESAIVEVIARHRPQDGVLTEEGGQARQGSSGLRWVVDPLDGTSNFLRGIAHHCISIGCERYSISGWQTVAAVVHDAARSETFSAVYGAGAFLNADRISVGVTNDPATALLATEWSYDAGRRREQARAVADLAGDVGDVRCTGSSALDLCWTACGRLDGYWEDELQRWDWLAGSLVVEEAGGVVSPLGTGVVAGGPPLHGWLRRRLTRAGIHDDGCDRCPVGSLTGERAHDVPETRPEGPS